MQLVSVEIHREAVYEVLSLEKYDASPALFFFFSFLNVDLSNSRQLVPKAKRISSHIRVFPVQAFNMRADKTRKPNNYTKGIHIIIK